MPLRGLFLPRDTFDECDTTPKVILSISPSTHTSICLTHFCIVTEFMHIVTMSCFHNSLTVLVVLTKSLATGQLINFLYQLR